MAVAHSKSVRGATREGPRLAIADLVLLRVATGGATRAQLQKDLSALVAPKVPGTAFRRMAELAIGQHTAQNLLSETKGRLAITPAGLRMAQASVGSDRVGDATWLEVRNGPLVALALGISGESAAIAKALDRADGLAALVLQRHFRLPTSRVLSHNDLRAELAVIALERAFGNKIKTGLSKGSGLPGKTARLLAGQLFKKPREFASDGKLFGALAADVAGATGEDLEALRLALLRQLTSPPLDAQDPEINSNTEAATALPRGPGKEPKAANDATPLAESPVKHTPPDMAEFTSAVLDAARPVSQGWPGNRKAFISQVWQAIRLARREWDLSEIVFKSMLAEAHRTGQLVLATADLKDKSALKELEDSKILYKNTVWHFVRVED
ncbi:MAG: hypothetical protein JNL45_04620 [Hyphomicrobium sp.]|nr:hypothetical protein [Hyphomicrobium sp.]